MVLEGDDKDDVMDHAKLICNVSPSTSVGEAEHVSVCLIRGSPSTLETNGDGGVFLTKKGVKLEIVTAPTESLAVAAQARKR